MISLNNLLNGFSAPNIYREEALLEGAQYSYYDKVMSQEQFDAVCKLDPTPNGKYQKWLLGMFANSYKYVSKAKQDLDNTTQTPENANALILRKRAYNMLKGQFDKVWFGEDAYKTTESLRLYDYITKKKVYLAELEPGQNQIMTIKNFGDLNQIIKSVTDKHPELLEADDVQSEASKNATKVFDQDGWLIVIPNTMEASCKYGANTKWCTAAREEGYNMYKKYTSDNGHEPDNSYPLYIIIDRNNNQKWQFHAHSNQFMDTQDEEISTSVLYDFPKNVLGFLANDEKIKEDSGYGKTGWREKIIRAIENYGICKKVYDWIKTDEARKVLAYGKGDSLIWENPSYIRFKEQYGSDYSEDAFKYLDTEDITRFCNTSLPAGNKHLTLEQASSSRPNDDVDYYFVEPWVNAIEVWWQLTHSKYIKDTVTFARLNSVESWGELETELLPLVYAKVSASEAQPQQ